MNQTYNLLNLNADQQVHRKWIQPGKAIHGSLAHWAFNKIEMYQRKIDLVDDGWSKPNFREFYLPHLLQRLLSAAMPIFALLDAIRPSNRGLSVWVFHVQVPVRGSNFFKSIVLLFSSFVMMPLAIYSPTTLYRTDDRWLHLKSSLPKTVKDFERRLDAITKSNSAEKKGLAQELYNMAKQISSGVKIGRQQEGARVLLKKAQMMLNQSKENDVLWSKEAEMFLPLILLSGDAEFIKTVKGFETRLDAIAKFNSEKESASQEIYNMANEMVSKLKIPPGFTYQKRVRALLEKAKMVLNLNQQETSTQSIEKTRFTLDLALWLTDAPADSHNLIADDIQQAFESNAIQLKLNHWCSSIPSCIGHLKHLKTLDLSDRDFKTLPKEIGQLTQLQHLNLGKNQLESLPKEIGQLAQLKHLNLGKNQLESLPKEIRQLAQLEELILSDNPLKSLPEEIGQLTQLKKLFLNHNQLKSLPKEIGKLTHLNWLDFSNNQLESLPEEIGQLAQLKFLILTVNHLKSLPKEIGKLTQLKDLELLGNQLESLPAEIGQLTQLEILRLSENQLKSLPAEIGQLSQLEKLSLGKNQLEFLPAALGQLAKLREIRISSNPKLTELPLSMGQIPNLTYIDISGTSIDETMRDAILAKCNALAMV